MIPKNENNIKIYLAAASALVIISVLLFFNPAAKQKLTNDSQVSKSKGQLQMPTVFIRQDSLLKLIKYFTVQHNSQFTADSTSSLKFSLHLSRFSSTPSTFYCNNSSLPNIQSDIFKIVIKQNTGEIDAIFLKKKIKGVYYVNVPTDVLCGLIKQHPNVR